MHSKRNRQIASPAAFYGKRDGTLRLSGAQGKTAAKDEVTRPEIAFTRELRTADGKNEPKPKSFQNSLALHRVREGVGGSVANDVEVSRAFPRCDSCIRRPRIPAGGITEPIYDSHIPALLTVSISSTLKYPTWLKISRLQQSNP